MTTSDPQTYREMNEPFANADAANAALDEFRKDLAELRKKHRIANLTYICKVPVSYDAGEGDAMTHGHFGNSLACLPMLAASFGKEQAEQRAIINQLVSGK